MYIEDGHCYTIIMEAFQVITSHTFSNLIIILKGHMCDILTQGVTSSEAFGAVSKVWPFKLVLFLKGLIP